VDPRLRKAVRLRTADTYQSVKTLHEAKRIRDAEEYNDFDNAAIPEIARLIRNHYKGEKLYHVLRLKDGQSREEIKMRLKAELAPDDCEVIPWDCSSKENGENKDLNKLYLKKKPSCHTFILIKQMFSCAKTLCDQHVGILFERVATKCEDAFILQSLLGRACGYNKSKDTIIFTSKKVVDRYLDAWLPFFEGRCDLETALWSLHGDKKGNWKHIVVSQIRWAKIPLKPRKLLKLTLKLRLRLRKLLKPKLLLKPVQLMIHSDTLIKVLKKRNQSMTGLKNLNKMTRVFAFHAVLEKRAECCRRLNV